MAEEFFAYIYVLIFWDIVFIAGNRLSVSVNKCNLGALLSGFSNNVSLNTACFVGWVNTFPVFTQGGRISVDEAEGEFIKKTGQCL